MDEDRKDASFQPFRVLVVEDSELDRKVLESMLNESVQNISFIKTVPSLATALIELEFNAYDIVILDLNLPDSNGTNTLIELNKKFPSVAIVVNTGAYEDTLGLRTLSFGAQDFLIKGKYTAYLLNKTLRYALERKRLEVELVSMHEKLRDAQSQLIHAEKMKVIGALASGVAHEVKNPLAVILYGVTFLEHHLNNPDEQIKMVIENIKDAVDRANVIVTDLLNFSSLTKLNLRLDSLNDVIDKSLSLVKHELEKGQIVVNKNLLDSLPQIKLDRNRIEQVLINLMLNAVQAMNKGGQLFLSTDVVKVSKDRIKNSFLAEYGFKSGEKIVLVNVEDTGSGISKDNLSKIFEPFFTTKRGTGGVGLGLAVSKNIMQIHDGYIHMENKAEGGARATLVFKLN